MPRSCKGDTPAVEGGPTDMKKAVGWIALILLIYYVGTNPGPAADIAQGIGSGVAGVFRNIGVFLRNLAT
jgi:hypothetical protein